MSADYMIYARIADLKVSCCMLRVCAARVWLPVAHAAKATSPQMGMECGSEMPVIAGGIRRLRRYSSRHVV